MSFDTPPDAHQIEVNGPTWLAIEARLKSNLLDAINKLKTQGIGDSASEFHRGRIKEIEGVLEMPQQQAKARAGMQGRVKQAAP